MSSEELFANLNGAGLLIHHWDTDGICSARLLLERLPKNIVNKTPMLGNYFLTDEEITAYSSYDFIIIVDMALPEDNILRLAQKTKVMIFDHHLQQSIPGVFHHNPIGAGKDPLLYPSASWIVNDFLGNSMNLSALLGIVGDHEKRIQTNKPIYELITSFCSTEHLTFDELLTMVYLLDSNYKVGDRNAVEEAPHLLLGYTDAHRILQNVRWKNNLSLLETEIIKYIDAPFEEKQNILLKRIHTKFNIISTVTRKIAWNSGKDTVVVNTGFFKDMDQIYVRSGKDLQPLIQQGKMFGYRCGGKREVLGAVVPKEKTESFLEEIVRFLILCVETKKQ
ncbi:MAG TPA: single-stranded DNA-specific exonuclease [Thermoplasmata archaeon]|nr:MAG TPA: single-stranded DNA-specific exonuclease [Thermoplasmata archaeon]